MSSLSNGSADVPAHLKQQLHDCVVAFEAVLWQTLRSQLGTSGNGSAAPLTAAPRDARERETLRAEPTLAVE